MGRARELRFAFTVDDFDAAVRLFHSGTVRHPAHRLVDEIEVGRLLGERVRIAVRVGDLEDAARAVAGSDAEVLAEPVQTPGATGTSASGRRTRCN